MRVQITIPKDCEATFVKLDKKQKEDVTISIQNHIINLLNSDLSERMKAEKFADAVLRSPEWRTK